jgi:RimJ/RimL family protein N-acetyltransferase
MERIDTPRLRLRVMDDGDEDLYCRLYTDPQVMHHVAKPLAIEVARHSFQVAREQAIERPMRRPWWVIHETTSMVDVGVVGLVREDAVAEIGIVLLPQAQRRGIAREAMSAVAMRAMATGLVTQLWLRHAPQNLAMAAVASQLGLTREDDGPGPDSCRWRMRAGESAVAGEHTHAAMADLRSSFDFASLRSGRTVTGT